jgi:hypothetical protein
MTRRCRSDAADSPGSAISFSHWVGTPWPTVTFSSARAASIVGADQAAGVSTLVIT